MRNSLRHPTIPALLAALAVLATVFPVVAACHDLECCPDAATDAGCLGCVVGSCEESGPEAAVIGTGLVLEQPPTRTTLLSPAVHDTDRRPAAAPVPATAALVATAVLLI